MKTPNEFDRKTCRMFREFVMNQIKVPDGVKAEAEGETYDSKTFTMKIKFTLTNCEKKSTTEIQYNSLRFLHGLPEWGFKFKNFDEEEFQMVDYRPRSHKYPIIAKKLSTGQKFKFSVNSIKNYIKE